MVSSTGRMKSFCGSGLYCSTAMGPSSSVTRSSVAEIDAASRTSAVNPHAAMPSAASSSARESTRAWFARDQGDGEALGPEPARHGGPEAPSCSDDRDGGHDR
ncbi:MAG: hypothetical protein L0I24_14100 [Pseudonocardia sp.]|nr:hypothetical protein [Pseudonocardia sp.]